MASTSAFHKALENAVLERHCANHPMTEKWAKGELSRNAMMGWAIEHWHWVRWMNQAVFYTCASDAPPDAVELELDNFHEENDPDEPHKDFVFRFAAANGADIEKMEQGEGLPTTRLWRNWLIQVTREQPWYCGIAVTRIGAESQAPMIYSKLLPALRNIYKFPEEDIKHFWLHAEVDIVHGGRGYELLERHCTTPEMQDQAVYWARESARFRWLYFDGVYLHYEKGYSLA